jgi:hypothetical protein
MSAECMSTAARARRGARGRCAAALSGWTAGLLTVLALLLTSVVVTAQPSPSAPSQTRIVAVSDVHGAYDSLVSILKTAQIVDDKVAWNGGRATLVVVGDVLDRGSGSRRVLELLMRLEGEASAAGGRAQLVLGNHEVMNLTGELDYVASEDYVAYAAEESASERAAALARFRAAHAGTGVDDTLAADFTRRYPPGFFGQRAAFASGGRFGAWLLRQPVLLVLGDTAFVHGGLPAGLAGMSANDVNAVYSAALRDYLRAFDALVAAGVLHAEDAFTERPAIVDRYVADAQRATSLSAPVRAAAERIGQLTRSDLFGVSAVYWYRGTVTCSEPIERDRLTAILISLGAKRVVVGHTPTPTARVLSRFDGMVLRVDTGMQQRGGRASALVLEGAGASAIYAGEPAAVPIASQPRLVGPRAGGYDDPRLKEVLTNAAISARAKRGDGTTQLTLAADGGAIEALFEPAPGRRAARFVPDVAAFRLDALLGFDLAPVAVLREVDGNVGAIYLDPAKLPDETARTADNAGGDAWCPLADQLASAYVFDALAGNEGRSADELRYTQASWQLALTGNRRSFDTSTAVPSHLRSQPLVISPHLRERLQSLNEAAVSAALGDVLDGRRVQAILARRDLLLAPRGD